MLKYMLDTNIAIYTIKNRPAEVREAFIAHDGQMCISVVTFMELIYGAEASAAVRRNLRDERVLQPGLRFCHTTMTRQHIPGNCELS